MLYILYLCNVYSEHFLADALIVFLYIQIRQSRYLYQLDFSGVLFLA